MRVILGVLLACSLAADAEALRLEGTATYKAVGKCFTPTGGVLLGANNNKYRPFSLARTRVKETITFILD